MVWYSVFSHPVGETDCGVSVVTETVSAGWPAGRSRWAAVETWLDWLSCLLPPPSSPWPALPTSGTLVQLSSWHVPGPGLAGTWDLGGGRGEERRRQIIHCHHTLSPSSPPQVSQALLLALQSHGKQPAGSSRQPGWKRILQFKNLKKYISNLFSFSLYCSYPVWNDESDYERYCYML